MKTLILHSKTFIVIFTLFNYFNLNAADTVFDSPGSVVLVSTPITVTDNLIIRSGTYLKVTSTISLSANSKITIEQGAILNLNGGTLTSTSDDISVLWLGVEVLGNSNYSFVNNSISLYIPEFLFPNNYTSLDYGVFYSGVGIVNNDFVNAEVKNSKYGIVSSSLTLTGPSLSNCGGYIETRLTDFTNNIYHSIYFTKVGSNVPYSHTNDVANCTFNSSLTSTFSGLDNYAQIVNFGGGNVRIWGSIFNCTNQSSNYVCGILAVAAKTQIFSNEFNNQKCAVNIRNENLVSTTLSYSFITNNIINHKSNTTFAAINIQNSDLINVRSNTIYYEANLSGAGLIININDGSDKCRVEYNTISMTGSINSSDQSTCVAVGNSAPFFGQVAKNTFFDAKWGITSLGNNTGLIFKCNSFNSIRGNDFNNYKGGASPLQVGANVPAENLFLPSPSSPSGRTNLKAYNNSLGFKYFYVIGVSNTMPSTFDNPPYYIASATSNASTCNIILSRILPNGGDPGNDNTYGISVLGLNSTIQNTYVHLQDIAEKSKLICDYLDNHIIDSNNLYLDSNLLNLYNYLDSNHLDSSIDLLVGDTSFFAVYTLSKLYLNNVSNYSTALTLVANANNNGNFEFVNYKLLFPIIVNGMASNYSEVWFDSCKAELESIANNEGFISAQAKSILEYYTNSSNVIQNLDNSVSYDFSATCSPSPFANSVTVNITNNEISITDISIELFDQYGISQLQTHEEVDIDNPQSILLNTSLLSNGIYTCVISTNGHLLKYIFVIKS